MPACASLAGSDNALACLRGANLTDAAWVQATALTFGATNHATAFVPVFDQDIFPAVASVVLPTGRWSKLPFITGHNLDEGERIPFSLVAGRS